MYWIIRTTSEWNNQELHAQIESNPRYPLQKPYWWGGERVNDPNLEFKFLIEPQSSYPDSLWTATIYDLFSSRLISILKKHKVNHEIFKTTIMNKNNNNKLDLSHQVFRILEIHPALDKNKSVFEEKKIKHLEFIELKKLVLREDFLKSKIPIARVRGHQSIVLVSDDLKQEFASKNITGFYYYHVDQYRM
jgi:hypothetical protein